MTTARRPRRPENRPTARPKVAKTSRPDSPAPPRAETVAGPVAEGERLVVLAAVAGAHGLKGEVRLKLFTEDLAAHRTVLAGSRRLTLEALRGEVARFTEVTDRTTAEGLRGTELAVPRSALPTLADGEYYHSDLLGLPCVSSAGEPLGRVVLVDNFGASDVLEVERPDGRRFMVPMRPEAVPSFDAERLVINPDFVEP